MNPTLGIALMIAAVALFAAQDGISRYLAAEYNTILIVMIRYWIFTATVLAIFATRPGGILGVAKTPRPWLQFGRGALLAAEIIVAVQSFVLIGLIGAHAVFATFPLIVAALSGPILGEHIGWRRWTAIGVGFIGILILLRPGIEPFSPYILLPILSAIMFALYQLLTRKVAAFDAPATSFFWTGIGGVVVMTAIGPFFWEPIAAKDWPWMITLAITALVGHFLLIKALAVAEAGTIQPFNYFHLVFIALIGTTVFGETLDTWTVVGATIVVCAGLFTLFRAKTVQQQRADKDFGQNT